MPAQFIDPDRSLEDCEKPHEKRGLPICSGYQAISEAASLMGQSRIFDAIATRIAALDMPYEDQCSIDYYFDLVRVLRDLNGEYDRVVEVGVFMGGASAILAGAIGTFDFDLDLVDIDADCLAVAYERLRRTFPDAAGRVRLWHGDVPSYVRHVMMEEAPSRALIHHDGSHNFCQVVADLAALSFVQDQIHAIIAQDTHLRSGLDLTEFVDLALAGVFGADLNYMPIGRVYSSEDSRTSPDCYKGNYFLPNTPEGMVLPMNVNTFQYPHPTMSFGSLFPELEATGSAVKAAA